MDRTTKYAESVVNGTIDRNVGHTEYLACKRHLNDLERQGTEDFPFVFDEKKSLEIIKRVIERNGGKIIKKTDYEE